MEGRLDLLDIVYASRKSSPRYIAYRRHRDLTHEVNSVLQVMRLREQFGGLLR